MRRERNILMVVALFAVAAFFSVAPSALADDTTTPAAICKDLQDGAASGKYTAAQIAAFLQDPTVQGYCGPITIVVAPPPACVELAAGATPTPGVTYCSTSTPTSPPQPCVELAAGATPMPGVTYCQKPAPVVTPPAAQSPVSISVVKGTQHTAAPAVKGAQHTVKGTSHTVAAPATKSAAAPLNTTRTSGTLPFTGAQLALFTLVGLALIATGLLLRTTTPRRGRS
jgi:hypothetical protein